MGALIDHLDRLYRLAFEAKSDPDFYQAIYYYCDFVVNNPTTSKLLADDQERYASEHSKLWSKRPMTDEETDKAAEATVNLERLSLYCNFSLILVRIYWPIDDLRKTVGSDSEQDPVALLMLKGIKNISTNRWSKEVLKTYNRWFEGNRIVYENSLRRFHTQLLSAVGNLQEEAIEKSPLKRSAFYFNSHTGDFLLNKTQRNLNPKSQEGKVFSALFHSPDHQAEYIDLIRAFRPHIETPSKAHKDDLAKIINSIKKELGEERSAIQNVKNVGYRLVIPARKDS